MASKKLFIRQLPLFAAFGRAIQDRRRVAFLPPNIVEFSSAKKWNSVRNNVNQLDSLHLLGKLSLL